MEQWRTVLAVGLSILVMFLYSYWFAPPPISPNQAINPVSKNTQPMAELPSKERPQEEESEVAEGPGEEFTLENKTVRATFSTRDAAITHWELKDFHEGTDKKSAPIDLLGEKGKALVLNLGEGWEEAKGIYTVEKRQEADHWKVVFERETANLTIQKEIRIFEDRPMEVTVHLTNRRDSGISIEPGLVISREQKPETNGGVFSFLTSQMADLIQPVFYKDQKFEMEAEWKKLGWVEKVGAIQWSGLNDRYFLMGLIAREDSPQNKIQYGRKGGEIFSSLGYGSVYLAPGQSISKTFSVTMGAKNRENLSRIGVGLEKSVDYGWFGFVAVPLLKLLIFFNKILSNWGLAIILLTFVVKMALHPINKKSLNSMKAMQRLQPRLQEIREQYKDNKERLNLEMMQLFKTHKVNPMGGCLPMLVQFPVYIALYRVLWSSIELYHAPFFWFYKDLSAPDPYFISPVLLGIFMVAQQKLTPQSATMDPAQQKVMMFMPVMFAGFLLFFPFGLVLYILVNTVMSVIQQYMVQHDLSTKDLVRKLIKPRVS